MNEILLHTSGSNLKHNVIEDSISKNVIMTDTIFSNFRKLACSLGMVCFLYYCLPTVDKIGITVFTLRGNLKI